MNGEPGGQIVTFYSFKGGTGRSMALANVAWILAANGKRVLVVDWDLEAPGLDRFFRPFVPAQAIETTGGVIDLIRAYEDDARERNEGADDAEWFREYTKFEQYAFSLIWPSFPGRGTLDVLPAGLQNDDYSATVFGLDWENLYRRLRGGEFLDALRLKMKERYDYVLIDSRTGLSDVVDICTRHLPDILVTCFTYSDQGIDGAARMAQKIVAEAGEPGARPRVLPVPMRVDDRAEMEKLEAGRMLSKQRFAGLPEHLSDADRDAYWSAVEVPYVTYYSYEETLATFGEAPGPSSLLHAYERLTAAVTHGEVEHLPWMEESTRLQWRHEFTRKVTSPATRVVLQYAAEDQVWAEWIERVLRAVEVTVVDPGPIGANSSEVVDPELQVLSIVSSQVQTLVDYTLEHPTPSRHRALGVYLADVRPSDLSFANTVNLMGSDEEGAVQRVLALVGHEAHPRARQAGSDVRYPGREPSWFKLDKREAQFTGRTEDLQQLRRELLNGGTTVALVALQGIGGIGKTMLALEYAHRFRAAYDLVWWVTAQPAHFVDAALAALAHEVGVSRSQDAMEAVHALREALRQGRPTDRWLIVFDNAENVDLVSELLPSGKGHVIVTSRNSAWEMHAKTLPVDVFTRDESVRHLRGRVPSLTAQQADAVAATLGDLPIAVNTAAALLAETRQPVEPYLDRIARSTTDEPWKRVWTPSLDELAARSPAAYRLLQVCSVMASEIPLELVYGEAMAEALLPLDQLLSDRTMRATLVRQIGRLGLMQVAPHDQNVNVHRLIQSAVRDRMTPSETEQMRHIVHEVLASARPQREVDDPTAWPAYQALWPHLEVSEAVRSSDFQVRALVIDRVRYLWRRGDLERASELAREVIAGWQVQLDRLRAQPARAKEADLLETQFLHLRFNYANILRDQALYGLALEIDEEVLARQTELLKAVHPHTLMTAGSHAADLRAVGRYDDALRLEQATSDTWVEHLGSDHPRALSAANNLAVSYRAVGRFAEALKLDQQVLKARSDSLGADHPLTLHSASCLGRDLREAGRYDESVTLLRRVLADFERTSGQRSQGRLSAQTNLAVSLRSAGDVGEAADLLNVAFDRLQQRFGEQSPYTIACRLSRAVTILAMGEVDTAIEELAASAERYESSLGRQHPMTLICLNDLAAAYRAAGDLQLAAGLAEEVVQGCDESLGARHPFTLAVRQNLATCRHELGETPAALELCREVSALMDEVLGDDHPDAIGCRLNASLVGSGRALHDARGSDLHLLSHVLQAYHPAVTEARRGQLIYRLLDPGDPF